jgi:hypothetical protein
MKCCCPALKGCDNQRFTGMRRSVCHPVNRFPTCPRFLGANRTVVVGLLSLGHQKASDSRRPTPEGADQKASDTRRALTQKGSDTRRALTKGMAAPQANESDNMNQRCLIGHSADKGQCCCSSCLSSNDGFSCILAQHACTHRYMQYLVPRGSDQASFLLSLLP